MAKKKCNIIFSIISASTFLVLAYLFGIILEFSYDWITSEFLFVIFSGALASSLVVLISEIFNYNQLKRTLENELNFHSINLFETVCIANNMIKSTIDNADYQIPYKMFIIPQNQMLMALNCIYNIDYVPFNKKNKLFASLQIFKSKYNEFKRIIDDCSNLDLAVDLSKIQILRENPYNNQPINSTYPLVSKTLKILQKNFETLLNDCGELLERIDYSGRFMWQETKEQILQNTRINIVSDSLEEFFEKNK